MTNEDIQVWENDRKEFMKNPDEFKKRVRKELSFANRAICEACVFGEQCDGYDYSPTCINPAMLDIDVYREAENYCNFLEGRGWETE